MLLISYIGLEYLFLVGGFAESPILQFEMRREFEHRVKIVIPQEVSLTILKGKSQAIFCTYMFNDLARERDFKCKIYVTLFGF